MQLALAFFSINSQRLCDETTSIRTTVKGPIGRPHAVAWCELPGRVPEPRPAGRHLDRELSGPRPRRRMDEPIVLDDEFYEFVVRAYRLDPGDRPPALPAGVPVPGEGPGEIRTGLDAGLRRGARTGAVRRLGR